MCSTCSMCSNFIVTLFSVVPLSTMVGTRQCSVIYVEQFMYNIVGRQASNGYTYYDGTLGPREASRRQGRCPKSEWVCSSRTLQRRRESAGQEWQRQKGGGYWSFLFRRRSGYSIHTSLLCRSLVCPMKKRG